MLGCARSNSGPILRVAFCAFVLSVFSRIKRSVSTAVLVGLSSGACCLLNVLNPFGGNIRTNWRQRQNTIGMDGKYSLVFLMPNIILVCSLASKYFTYLVWCLHRVISIFLASRRYYFTLLYFGMRILLPSSFLFSLHFCFVFACSLLCSNEGKPLLTSSASRRAVFRAGTPQCRSLSPRLFSSFTFRCAFSLPFVGISSSRSALCEFYTISGTPRSLFLGGEGEPGEEHFSS